MYWSRDCSRVPPKLVERRGIEDDGLIEGERCGEYDGLVERDPPNDDGGRLGAEYDLREPPKLREPRLPPKLLPAKASIGSAKLSTSARAITMTPEKRENSGVVFMAFVFGKY